MWTLQIFRAIKIRVARFRRVCGARFRRWPAPFSCSRLRYRWSRWDGIKFLEASLYVVDTGVGVPDSPWSSSYGILLFVPCNFEEKISPLGSNVNPLRVKQFFSNGFKPAATVLPVSLKFNFQRDSSNIIFIDLPTIVWRLDTSYINCRRLHEWYFYTFSFPHIYSSI